RDTAMYGDPLVVTKTFGKGQTIVFLTTAGMSWNSWAGTPPAAITYPIVMTNLQKYLTSTSDDGSRYVGTPLDITLDAAGYHDPARVFFQPAPREREGEKAEVKEGERELETVVGKEDDSKQLRFSFNRTREPGLYRVEIKGKPRANDAREPQPFNEAYVFN